MIIEDVINSNIVDFSEIPPKPIKTPIVMKNGTAINENEEIPLTICCGRVASGMP